MWYILLLAVAAADTTGGDKCHHYKSDSGRDTTITVPQDKDVLEFFLSTESPSANVTIAVGTERFGIFAEPVEVYICADTNYKSQLRQPRRPQNAQLEVGKCSGGQERRVYNTDRVTILSVKSSAPVTFTWMLSNTSCQGAETPPGGDGAKGSRPVAGDGAKGSRPVAGDGAKGSHPVAGDGAKGSRPVAEDGSDEGRCQHMAAVAWVLGCLLLASLLANLTLGLRYKKQLAAAESQGVVSHSREKDLASEQCQEQGHHLQEPVFRQKHQPPPHWSSRLPSAYESENSLYGYPIANDD